MHYHSDTHEVGSTMTGHHSSVGKVVAFEKSLRHSGPKLAPPNPTSTSTSSPQQCAYSSPMPPWVASVPRLTSLRSGRTPERVSNASCRRYAGASRLSDVRWHFHDRVGTHFHARIRSHLRGRFASTHVAPTAINLRPNIPPRNQELHNALSALSGAAETYVNISRLQLALSGLAAQDAVTRVAGRNDNLQLV